MQLRNREKRSKPHSEEYEGRKTQQGGKSYNMVQDVNTARHRAKDSDEERKGDVEKRKARHGHRHRYSKAEQDKERNITTYCK